VSTARQWQVVGIIIALLGAGLVYSATLGGASRVAPVRVGAPAPDFRAATLDGTARTRTLADYRGEVLLVNLWATWCAPCVIEMPSIQRLYDRYRDAGLKVVAVAVDDPGYEQRVLDFVADRKLTFEILHEGTGKIEQTFQTQGIPATFLIGRDGRIRKLSLGADDWDSPANRAVVAQLLGVDEAFTP
jgi:peroxiredoxin